MKKSNLGPTIALLLFLLCVLHQTGIAAESYYELDDKRISQIEAMLPIQPAGFGRQISDRNFWATVANRADVRDSVPQAELLLKQKFPAWSDDLYLDFSRTGTRPPGEKMQKERKAWLYPLIVAECSENQGRFIPLINQVMRDYVSEPSWTLPAHDGNLDNFKRRKYSVDLASSAFAAELAQAIYLIGDQLDPLVRQQVMAAIEARIFVPIRHSLLTGEGSYWLGNKKSPTQNNWNAVCLAGVVSAARTLLPDRHDRALFIAAGEHYSAYFINGFRGDGYCDEGAGYWAYGFGSYVILREVLADATHGDIDLFANPKIRNIALYGERIQLMENATPPFADCRFGTKVDAGLVGYCNRVLKFGGSESNSTPSVCNEKLAMQFMSVTPCAAVAEKVAANDESIALRSFFDQAGVLVCRPKSGTACRISAAIKAGGNGSHSHNDIGSFVINFGDEELVGDPGGPYAYNNKVFGPERYTYKILNSFGHPVPVVAGQLQKDATKVHPKILKTRFTPAQDQIQMDLKPAYEVPELQKLEREMSYSRDGTGEVVIRDTVLFSKPMSFEIALQTLGSFHHLDPRTIEFEMKGKKLLAEIETPDGFQLNAERIEELGAPAFTRLGIKLLKPVKNAEVSVKFRSTSDQNVENPHNSSLFPAGVKRVVFLGDSITYIGQYVEDIAAFQHAKFPDRQIEFVNVGLPSETVSGLSEPGHAGGKFPRPDLHERLARILEKTKPDLVFACYGMNDGIYLPFDETRFKAFRDGIEWLHTEVEKSGAKMIHVTPPIFDEIKGGHPGYAEVLDRYSEWLRAQRALGWQVVDAHFPMKKFLMERRAVDSTFALTRDGIHPGDLGHWLMAQQVLIYLGVNEAAAAGSIDELMSRYPDGESILHQDQKDQIIWKDAWLTATGHKRPGMKRGLPIEISPQTGEARLLRVNPESGKVP